MEKILSGGGVFMLQEWKRVWEARRWMKRNEGFLPTWHAYLGFKMRLFDELVEGKTMEAFLASSHLDQRLLKNWVETGIVIGHLQVDRHQIIRPAKRLATYFTQDSPYSIGELLREMMELHIPTLLSYPDLMSATKEKLVYHHEQYGQTVAETSAMIEKLAIRYVHQWIKQARPNSILDIGCGHAGYLIALSKRYQNKEFVGIDMNSKVIEAAQQKIREQQLLNVNVYQEDVGGWLAKGKSFDHIMLNNILHYFDEDKRKDLFNYTNANLRENGTLTLISPMYLNKNGKAFSAAFNSFMTAHQNLHPIPTEVEIQRYSEQAGYRIERIKPVVREGGWYFIGLRKVNSI